MPSRLWTCFFWPWCGGDKKEKEMTVEEARQEQRYRGLWAADQPDITSNHAEEQLDYQEWRAHQGPLTPFKERLADQCLAAERKRARKQELLHLAHHLERNLALRLRHAIPPKCKVFLHPLVVELEPTLTSQLYEACLILTQRYVANMPSHLIWVDSAEEAAATEAERREKKTLQNLPHLIWNTFVTLPATLTTPCKIDYKIQHLERDAMVVLYAFIVMV